MSTRRKLMGRAAAWRRKLFSCSLLSRKVQTINFSRHRQNLRREGVAFMAGAESVTPACRDLLETIIAERVCHGHTRFSVRIRYRNACTEDASPIPGQHATADGNGRVRAER